MKRKDVFYIFIVTVALLLASALSIALAPIWIPVMLLNPSITTEVQLMLTRQVVRRAMS